MPYVELAGITSYYEQHGSGDPVLLLHGGFCSLETWHHQVEALAPHYRVHAAERPGHGRTPDRPGPVTFEAMVTDTLAYLDAFDLDRVHVVGFSDGAIIGLLLAMHHPERVRSLASISANLDPDAFADDGDPGTEDTEDAGEDDYAEIRAAYDRLSPDGPEHAEPLLEKLMALWTTQPQIDPSELGRISAPALVMAGDGDHVTTAHTTTIARSIPGARLCIVPGARHMVIEQQPALVNLALLEFLGTQPH